ncbi:MAG: S1C family serine protease [Candidatus Coproplasma sp.]
MKKKFVVSLLLAVTLLLSTLCGCASSAKSIVSIVKTDSIGFTDYYTITYTDGSTSVYTITNNNYGSLFTVDELYEFYKQSDPDITREEFIEKFLKAENGSSSQDNLTALSSLFRSGMKIYSVFNESSDSTYESNFTGSGVIYKIESDYAYILTNYHMIYDDAAVTEDKTAKKVFAYMYGSNYAPVRTTSGELVIASDDNFGLTCEYVGGSAECDVAIVKVPTAQLLSKYPQAEAVVINQSYQVGQTVYALGNPNGQGLSLTKGIISVDLEIVALNVAGTRNYYLLRTDADLDHGSSGGGLFNAQGELIALCNSGSDTVTSINYAIPASNVVPCAEGILYYNGLDSTDHNTYRMRLGVTVYENNCRYIYDSVTQAGCIKADITVSEPEAGSTNPIEGLAAHAMGLQAGDVIRAFSINGTKYEMKRMIDLTNVLMQVREGDSVTMTVRRNGEEIESSAYTVAKTDLVSM